MDVPEVFDKVVEDRDYHLSAGEAQQVWWEVYQLFKTYPDHQGGMLKHLFSQIEQETWEGKRCGVCAVYDSPDCWKNC